MASQVLNFLWLNLDFPAPPDPEDGSIRRPLPEEYIENMRNAAKAHPAAQIDFWIDSNRLTRKQIAYLRHVAKDGMPNIRLRNLRSIPAYRNEKLFNDAETAPYWREDQTTLIWRQVDLAKILISLQRRGFDQHFFADFDKAHMDIESEGVQEKLAKHGMFIGNRDGNQLWGFNATRRRFFEEYYAEALRVAYRGQNAWRTLCDKVRNELEGRDGIPFEQACIVVENKGPRSSQPGHRWNGRNPAIESNPALVSAKELSAIFNSGSVWRKAAHMLFLKRGFTPSKSDKSRPQAAAPS